MQLDQFQHITKENVPYRLRASDSHKGTFGHVLVVAGSYGMAGASFLAAKAALRSGCGLVTVHAPKCNRIILQTALPEAIFQADKDENVITKVAQTNSYNALIVGPGIGTNAATAQMLHDLLQTTTIPLVIDADALNILSQNKTWLSGLPSQSILAPHPKEFDRLFGTCTHTERAQKALTESKKNNCIIVLKGAGTQIYCPDGQVFINTTGNSGLATGGTGDVLAGMLGGLLAQGYTPQEAAIRAVFLHGQKADDLLKTRTEEEIIASDLLT